MHVSVLVLLFSLLACSNSYQLVDPSKPKLVMADAKKTVGFVEVFDDEALKYIDRDAKISIRGEGFNWIEGPAWVSEGNYLLFSDIPENIIVKYDPEAGTSIYMHNPGYASYDPNHKGGGSNGLLINSNNQLVLMQQGARQVSIMDAPLSNPKHKFVTLAKTYQDQRLNSPNDLVEHSDGSLYFTDPNYGLNTTDADRIQQLPFRGIYRLTSDGTLTLLDKTLTYPNGIGLSPDEKTLYVAVSDVDDAIWVAYDLTEYGLVENKRKFYDANYVAGKEGHAGYPDGMAVHSSGVIFATGPGGVWLFTPEAKVLAIIRTGENTSNCTLTTNEEYLFITADDYLMSVPLKI